jgi:hypothetical protein
MSMFLAYLCVRLLYVSEHYFEQCGRQAQQATTMVGMAGCSAREALALGNGAQVTKRRR